MKKQRHTSKRLNSRLLISALLLVLFVCCSSLALANSQEATSPQEQAISVPLSDWNLLKERLMKAENSINNSNLSLTEAQALTVKQESELRELKIINEEREKDLIALKDTNKKQGEELEQASKIITQQANTLGQASTSLDELKNEIKRNHDTEKRLRRQRDTWAISNAALFLVGAFHR